MCGQHNPVGVKESHFCESFFFFFHFSFGFEKKKIVERDRRKHEGEEEERKGTKKGRVPVGAFFFLSFIDHTFEARTSCACLNLFEPSGFVLMTPTASVPSATLGASVAAALCTGNFFTCCGLLSYLLLKLLLAAFDEARSACPPLACKPALALATCLLPLPCCSMVPASAPSPHAHCPHLPLSLLEGHDAPSL